MDPLRISRVASMMKDELSLIINRELKDPRVPFVTITNVELTRDTKQATVHVSIISVNATHTDPDLMRQVLEALREAKGFIKKQLAAVMQLRFMPDLVFKEDKGLENTLRVNEILKQLEAEKKAAGVEPAATEPTNKKSE
jgi:ribosome-binding factor A